LPLVWRLWWWPSATNVIINTWTKNFDSN
jgi:hypothetical protein